MKEKRRKLTISISSFYSTLILVTERLRYSISSHKTPTKEGAEYNDTTPTENNDDNNNGNDNNDDNDNDDDNINDDDDDFLDDDNYDHIDDIDYDNADN